MQAAVAGPARDGQNGHATVRYTLLSGLGKGEAELSAATPVVPDVLKPTEADTLVRPHMMANAVAFVAHD